MSRKSNLWAKRIKQATQIKTDRICPKGQIRKEMEIRIQTRQPMAGTIIKRLCPGIKSEKAKLLDEKLSLNASGN